MEQPASKSFAALLAGIADVDSPVPVGDLCQLSDMPAESAASFGAAWPTIPLQRRREIMRRLADICQTNFEVDFAPVAMLGMLDPDRLVRLSAVDTLWDSEAPEMIAPVLRLVHDDPEPAVQASAAGMLGQFVLLGELGGLPPGLFDGLTEALLAVVSNAEKVVLVRCRALEALAAACLGEVPGLIRDAYQSGEEALRISAVAAMGRTADPSWEPIIRGELDNVEPSMRYHAAQAAGGLQLPTAVPQLVELLDDPDPEVIAASTRSLGEIGGVDARAALEGLLDDEEVGALAEDALEMANLAEGLLSGLLYHARK